MDKLKTILTLIAVILVALAVLAGIGFIYTFLSYLMILGIVCLAAVIGFRFLRGSNRDQIRAADPHQELKKIERLLDEYKRK
jgi:membrane protein implicated in regulation of membrane protease activity